jgi:divalent metal cation (Fe/Co/Zn/Cd) transporter
VRVVHNVTVLTVDGRTEVALHLKLPGELTLGEAHALASQVEDAIVDALPEVDSVQTHLEPLAEAAEGREPSRVVQRFGEETVLRIVREVTSAAPRELRFLEADDGLLLFLTLALDPASPLSDAHTTASAVEERIRRELPAISEIIVHTEP